MAKGKIDEGKLRKLVEEQKTAAEIAEELNTDLTTSLKNRIYKVVASIHEPDLVDELTPKRTSRQLNIQPVITKNKGINLSGKLLGYRGIEIAEGTTVDMEVSPEKDRITLKLIVPEQSDNAGTVQVAEAS